MILLVRSVGLKRNLKALPPETELNFMNIDVKAIEAWRGWKYLLILLKSYFFQDLSNIKVIKIYILGILLSFVKNE
jgi:hypothetical protein